MTELLDDMNRLFLGDVSGDEAEVLAEIECHLIDLEERLVAAGLKKRGRPKNDDEAKLAEMERLAASVDWGPEKLSVSILKAKYGDKDVVRLSRKFGLKHGAKKPT